MNGAVWGGYFEQYQVKEMKESSAPFLEQLGESVCADCGSRLFSDSQLLMAYSDAVRARKEMDLTKYVKNRADSRLWHGEEAHKQLNAGDALGAMLADLNYQPRCPCCAYSTVYGDRSFDFHHWDYENDIGCTLCRECHSYIHRGKSVSEQKEAVDDWKTDAIQRLYDRATGKFLDIRSPEEMTLRFNITLPSSQDTKESVRMMLQSRLDD
jgi:hypothetical protein